MTHSKGCKVLAILFIEFFFKYTNFLNENRKSFQKISKIILRFKEQKGKLAIHSLASN